MLRIAAAVAASVATALIGLYQIGLFDGVVDEYGLSPTATRFSLVLAIALFVGFGAYATVEWLQTRRLDSIARQFDTRTIVLIPIAIAINVVLGQTTAYALKLPLYLDSIGTILVAVLAGPIAGAATGVLGCLAWTFLFAGTPFGSPYAWPFSLVAAEIGLVAGLFGFAGVFRSRAGASLPRLASGLAAGIAVLAGLVWFGILPFYRSLCPDIAGAPGRADDLRLCFELFNTSGDVDPVLVVLSYALVAIVAVLLIALVVRLARDRDLGVVYVLVAGATCGVISALIATPIAALVTGGVTGSGTDLLVAAFQKAGSDLEQAVAQQALISDPIDKTIAFLLVFTILGAASRRVLVRFPQGERALGTIEG